MVLSGAVMATDGTLDYPLHGAQLSNEGWFSNVKSKDGKEYHSQTFSEYVHNEDVVEEWVDTPNVQWYLYPLWFKYVAQDINGEWWAFIEKPTQGIDCWTTPNHRDMLHIQENYVPEYKGNWNKSLVKRPE